jgi:hypothetical protein
MIPITGRRHVIRSLVGGSILMPAILAHLLEKHVRAVDRDGALDPLAPKPPHFAPRAQRVIFLFMSGGVSHLDTFDPKPRLVADATAGSRAPNGRSYLRPYWEFRPRGQSGIEVSSLFPHLAGCVDDLCLIRSMRGQHNDHFQATLGIHTGSVSVSRPSLGSWVSYGLGTENQNLPSFIVLAPLLSYAGSQVFSADFLPGCHQGTRVLAGPEPIPNLVRRAPSGRVQAAELALLDQLNRRHLLDSRGSEAALAARMQLYDTAFGMQMAAPEALELGRESDATLRLYGLERGSTQKFGWQCLVARRLIERGVRFVELIDSGSSNNWDSHSDMRAQEPLARNVDRPIAGLLADLKGRGLLDDTLVVWTTEFGRTRWIDGPTGRSHHNAAYCSWLAGGGVRGGVVHGKTDDHGARIVEDEVHVHDLHATILHLLGLDHQRLTFRHAGRDFRLTDVHGRVVHEILA